MTRPLLAVRGLHVAYGDRDALCDVTVSVTAGTTLAVIGPNGSGKSTLLRTVAGLLRPTQGSVEIDRRRVAFVLQSTDVDPAVPITVEDTVKLARYRNLGPLRRFRDADRAAVATAMERLDVSDLARRPLRELSGGQRQRTLVAQGLAQDADLLLLDEPVTGLDLVSKERIMHVMAEERAAGRGVVMTTHSLDDARRCDQVLLLAGRTIAVGTADEVIVEHHLRDAYGGRVARVGDHFVLDDPHHH